MVPISVPKVLRMYTIFPASCSAKGTFPSLAASAEKLPYICPINSVVSAAVDFMAKASVLATFVTFGNSVLLRPAMEALMSSVDFTNSTALAP